MVNFVQESEIIKIHGNSEYEEVLANHFFLHFS